MRYLDRYVNAFVGLSLVLIGCTVAPGELQEVIVGGGLGIITAPVVSSVARRT